MAAPTSGSDEATVPAEGADISRIPAERLHRQVASILRAWGMPPEQVDVTARKMLEADLRGVDSHGVYMLPLYDELRRDGKLEAAAKVNVVRESPVTALIDGGGGLGHYPSHLAMTIAIDKCRATGVGLTAVRNSTHYGAAGVYALMAVEHGFMGLSTTAVFRPGVVPTFGAQAMLGTNPIAFAAPAKRNAPFCLDMATSTVAVGKLNLALLHGTSIPEGWATDDHGRPVTDPKIGLKYRNLTPLGGIPAMSSHKGYGLGAMVEILSTLLPGAYYAPTRAHRHPNAPHHNVGHFFMALDPKVFRDAGEFETDLDDLIDALHAAPRADPAQPVLVAGEPEERAYADRRRNGIPIPSGLARIVRDIAAACGAEFLLEEAT
jgi:LDH2 family malate/lactate/ureidoglycolate dehydrogenase